MKKLLLVVVTGLLTACGGSDYFNEASPDISACLVGQWEAQELSYPDQSSTAHYYADGTYVAESLIDFGTPFLSTIAFYLANLAVDLPIGESFRYIAYAEKGKWITEGRNLRRYDRAYSSVAGNDVDDITSRALADVLQKEPDTDVYEEALAVHCDDEYSSLEYRNIYIQTNTSPLEYTLARDRYDADGYLIQSHREILQLGDNGRATNRVISVNPLESYLDLDVTSDFDYRYSNGKLIMVGCEQSDTCPRPGRSIEVEYFDRSTALMPEEVYYTRVTD